MCVEPMHHHSVFLESSTFSKHTDFTEICSLFFLFIEREMVYMNGRSSCVSLQEDFGPQLWGFFLAVAGCVSLCDLGS